MQTEHDYIDRNEILEFLDRLEANTEVLHDEIIIGVVKSTVGAARKLVKLAKAQDVASVKSEVITPQEFAEQMKDISEMENSYGRDPEMSHIKADEFIIEVLTELGYGDGAKIFDNMPKWYS